MGSRSIFVRQGGSLPSGPSAQPQQGAESPKARSKAINKIFDAVITVCLFMIFLGVPIFFIGLSYQGVVFEKQIYFYFFLLVALVSWAAKGVISGEMKIRRTPLDIPIGIFWSLYALSTFFSVDRWHSFWGFFGDPSRGLMNVTALIIAYYLILSHFNEKRLKLMMFGVVSAGFVLSVWMVLGIFGVKFLPEKFLQIAPLSLVGSMSGAGVFFSFLILLLITLIFIQRSDETANKLKKNIISGFLLVGLVLAVFLTMALYNYIPWISLLIGLGLFLIYILSRIVRPAETWTWLPMAVFVVIMSILMIGSVQIARVNLPVEVSPAYNISKDIAKESLKQKFILGSGPGTYGYAFSLHRPQNFNQNLFYNLRFYQGSGILAEGLPTLGILGTISAVLLILSFLSVGFYLLTSGREKNKIYSLGLFSASVIIIVNSALARLEGTVFIFGSLLGALALAALLWESSSEEKYLNLTLKASPKFALALAFVFMVVTAGVAYLFAFVGKAMIADLYAGSAVRQKEISFDGSVNKLIRAINMNNREGRYYTRLGQEFMVLANNETLKNENERDINLIQDYLNRSLAAAARGRDLMSKDALAVETLATIYENAGLYVKDSLKLAEDTYKQSQELEPQNPNYPVKLGQIKLSLATTAESQDEKKQLVLEAKDLFQKALEKKSDLAAGYFQLSLAQEALGEIDAAIDNMKKAFSLERSSINYAFNLGRLYQARGKDEDNKLAEDLFKQILGVNDKEINTHFSLGLLYEKTNRRKEAKDKYEKVIELLPENSAEAKRRIEKMIANIQSGISNFTDTTDSPANNQAPVSPQQANPEEESNQ